MKFRGILPNFLSKSITQSSYSVKWLIKELLNAMYCYPLIQTATFANAPVYTKCYELLCYAFQGIYEKSLISNDLTLSIHLRRSKLAKNWEMSKARSFDPECQVDLSLWIFWCIVNNDHKSWNWHVNLRISHVFIS